ncbi:otogelin-like [Pristis pectinata]|uniref:otogelin-like n=1 Tax=Pristis pectinata TaxID=685728 RepID=UPI00223DFB8C|nr:otogelin-like [Pristis pectinata]
MTCRFDLHTHYLLTGWQKYAQHRFRPRQRKTRGNRHQSHEPLIKKLKQCVKEKDSEFNVSLQMFAPHNFVKRNLESVTETNCSNSMKTCLCSLPCLNAGLCVNVDQCDCSEFGANGTLCQAVLNRGINRDLICRTWGQYNYETFDGLYYYYPGKCTYTLVRECEQSQQSFSIQIHNDPACNSPLYSCQRLVSLFFAFEGEIILRNHEVIHHGKSVQLPYIIGNLKFEQIAGYILVKHHHGFSLAWDGSSGVYIKMSIEYVGKLCGLCGNFNGNMHDDLYTSYGVLTEEITIFGNSWIEDAPNRKPCHVTPINHPAPCSEQNQSVNEKIRNLCTVLLGYPFTLCHYHVQPYPYMASCMNELCTYGPDDNTTLCGVLTEYARACAQANRPLNGWRQLFNQCVECSVTGDIHFKTFDEQLYSFHAICQYILAKSRSSGKFTISLQNSQCGTNLNGACIQSVSIIVDEDPKKQVTLTHSGEVYHCNQYRISLPYKDDLFEVTELTSVFVQVNTNFGLRLQYDREGRRLYLQVDARWKEDTIGLCGTFNGNIQDDFLSPGGMIESTPQIFANSWRVSTACNPGANVPEVDPCDTHQQYASYATEKCSIISGYLFASCHQYLSPDLYQQQCKTDTCKCGQTCMCSAVAHYARQCGNFGIFVDFRSNVSECAIQCPSTMVYGPCVSFCNQKCQSLSMPEDCSNECTEGCACPDGTYYNTKTHTCVMKNDCPCYFMGTEYSPGEVAISSTGMWICSEGTMQFQSQKQDTQCGPGQIYFNCSALVSGSETNVGAGCGETCQNLLLNTSCPKSMPCLSGCVCPPGWREFLSSNFNTNKFVEQLIPSRNPIRATQKQGPDSAKEQLKVGGVTNQWPREREAEKAKGSESEARRVERGAQTTRAQLKPTCGKEKRSWQDDRLRSRQDAAEAGPTGIPRAGALADLKGIPRAGALADLKGLVKHEDECFKPEECPCLWKGKEYFPGDVVKSPCYICVCQQGTFQCTFHPCPSMCTAYGDRHFKTFDGVHYDFISGCKVYLVKSIGSLNLSITAENIDCYGSGTICKKALSISVGNTFLVFEDDSENLSPSSVMDTKQIMHIWKAGIFIMIHFPAEEISVLWDQKTTTHIQVGPKWQGKLSGLCGNFDMKTVNEMWTPDHMEAPNPQEFGNSWTAMECASSPDIRNPCNMNPLREPFAKKECGILLCEVFQPCHPVVDVTWFYSNCLTDTCACNRGGDCECFCTSVLAYAHVCCQHGVAIDWRTPTMCPYDCEYYNKVLGKGPYLLVSYLDASTVVAANLSSGAVFLATREISIPGVVTLFMLTPGLYSPKPHDASLVSLEVADKPNYFLRTGLDGDLHLSKWEYNTTFQKEATFKFHKDAWVLGYNAFESYIRPGYFVHLASSILHLLKYNHSKGFRHATLFQLVDAKILSPAHSTCEWQYETCASPCIRTCRDPTGNICQALPSVEGCVPRCPLDMVFDEDTQRCVYLEDCIRPAVYIQPSKSTSASASPGIFTSPAFNASVKPLTSSAIAEISQFTSFPIATSSTKTTVSTSTPMVTQLSTSLAVLTTSTSPLPSFTGTTTSIQKVTSRTTPTTQRGLVYSTESYTSPPSTLGSSARIITTEAATLPEMSTLMEATSPTELLTKPHFRSTSIETKHTVTRTVPSTTATGIALSSTRWLTTTKTIPSKTESLPEKTSSSTIVAYSPTETKSITQKTSVLPTSRGTATYATSKEMEPTVLPTFSKTTTKTTRSSYPFFTVHPLSTGAVSLTTEKAQSSTPVGAFKLSASTEGALHPSTEKLTTPSVISITESNKTTTASSAQLNATEKTTIYHLSKRTHSTAIPPVIDSSLTTLHTTSKEAVPTSTTTTYSTPSATISSESTALKTFPNKTTTSFLEHSYPSPSTKGPEIGSTVDIFKMVSTPQSTEMTSGSTTELHASSKSTSPQPTTAMRSTTTQKTTLLETSSIQTFRTSTTAIPTSIKVVPLSVSTVKTTTATVITQLGTTTILPTLLTSTSVKPSTVVSGLTSKMTDTAHAVNATTPVFSLSATTTPTSASRTITEKVTAPAVDVGGTKPTTVLFKTPLATETSTVSVNETSVTSAGVIKTTIAPVTSARISTGTEGKIVPSPQLTSTTEPVSVSLNGTVPTESKITSIKFVPSTTQSTTTSSSESQPYTLSNVTSSTITSAGLSESVAGPTVFSEGAYTTALTIPPTSHCIIPFPQDGDECITQICVEGQIMQINRSHHCPYIITPPTCELLGFAVQVNTDKCCPQWECPCRCSILANLHIITFDGSGFGISGAASYVIASTANETIIVGINECLSSQMTTMIQPQVNSSNLCLMKLNITHGSNIVIIDRQKRRLNINSKLGYTPFRRFDFEIVDTGSMYTILTPAGIVIQWFHSTGIMVIDTGTPNKKQATLGLCGYCDGNPINDLTLKNGTVLNKDDDPVIFVEDWTVASTETGIKMSRILEVNCSTSNCSECFRMLQSESFAPCHSQVSPEMFCELWIRDSLFVHNHCSALGAYVALCNKFNICLEWRKPDYCPFTCPPNMIYQACVLTCEAKTCQNRIFFPSEDASCSIMSEGCVCSEGSILHRLDSTLCIPEAKCACTDSWGLPHAAGETWNASVDGCCMHQCLENGTIVTVDHNCSAVPEPVCHRSGEVVVSLASDKSCCPNKICACNQTVCESFAPQCAYGERLITLYKPDFCCPDYFCECDPGKCGSDIPICREDQTLIATHADGSCCLAYICMCGACSDQIPTCQEGEILTVDNNTTEMCCPDYQCVCEINRCPKFQCPTGMQEIRAWSPDQCCPFHSCECACDTVPKPQCKLGEVLVIEQQLGNITANPCGCLEYKCVNDQVCIDGERGILRPGQAIVEHTTDGLCYSTQCTHNQDNKTGFYQLLVTMINCSAQCEMNQVYIPPNDLTTCCGVCKNVSCLDNLENETTTIHKPGTSWMSNCVRHDCTDTISGPVLITSNISCPPFNETACLKIGGSIITYMEGCCKSCKEDVKSCQKVVVRMTIRKNDCRSNRPVNIVSCDGKCPSASIYNYSINTHARFCKCCREIGLQKRMVQLYCSGNSTWVSYPIQEPTDCSCQWS